MKQVAVIVFWFRHTGQTLWENIGFSRMKCEDWEVNNTVTLKNSFQNIKQRSKEFFKKFGMNVKKDYRNMNR